MLKERKIGENDVWRMYRTFDSLIKKILESPKFFIGATKGRLYPQLLSVNLACDYRIIAENTTIQNVYLDFGLAPKGGEVFFLKKRLGHCKAFELLLSEKEIKAHDALKLGAVNKVVPLHSLEKITLKMAQEFAKKPADSVKLIKKLLNSSKQNPADFLEFENHELMHTLGFKTAYGRFGWRG
jgi:2-(1,2-epoxy-1,2-dihydrophenyl)acetyl-CoA isomerase